MVLRCSGGMGDFLGVTRCGQPTVTCGPPPAPTQGPSLLAALSCHALLPTLISPALPCVAPPSPAPLFQEMSWLMGRTWACPGVAPGASASPELLLPSCCCAGLGPRSSGGCPTLQPTSPWTPAMPTRCAEAEWGWLGEATAGWDLTVLHSLGRPRCRVCVARSPGTSRTTS